ncbi:MAG: hypothetical protein IIZ78_02515 [Clostridiales bacterium]|nr:hypothetical protein [Clostridiales bacterium]
MSIAVNFYQQYYSYKSGAISQTANDITIATSGLGTGNNNPSQFIVTSAIVPCNNKKIVMEYTIGSDTNVQTAETPVMTSDGYVSVGAYYDTGGTKTYIRLQATTVNSGMFTASQVINDKNTLVTNGATVHVKRIYCVD